jgi:Fic family protein
MIKKINSLRFRYHQAALNRKALENLIDESEVAEQVYNSNAIENSTLTLEETDKILQQINLDRFITERELFEAKNLARVVTYIRTKAKESELNLEVILLLHKMLISNINDDIAGRFRTDGEWVRVGNHIACDPKLVTKKIEEALIEYYSSSNHTIKKVALFHLMFEHTHPFCDGNGRIGRILNNYILIREGYVPINIKFVDRSQYYQAFKEYDQNASTKTMENIVYKALSNSFHKRLAYLESKEIISLSEYAKKNKLSHSNLLNKANRQTIEAFLEKGIWKIGI